MNRRSLLAGVGASSLALAGCLSVAESTITQDTVAEVPADPDDPIARSVIGTTSSDRPPHRVRLWNFDDERHAVDLEIESDDGSTSFNGSYDLDAEAHVVVFLHGQADYEVAVSVDDTDVDAPDLEADSFDDSCPATELFVVEGGDLEVETETEADHCE